MITGFRQEDLARMRPGDQVTVRACGQGWRHPGVPAGVAVLNVGPGLLATLPVAWPGDGADDRGRPGDPAQQAGRQRHRQARRRLGPGPAAAPARARAAPDGLLLGDLVAVTGLDARHNMGYRRGWLTVGVVVHGTSPLPGHGPGITPILTGPVATLSRGGRMSLVTAV